MRAGMQKGEPVSLILARLPVLCGSPSSMALILTLPLIQSVLRHLILDSIATGPLGFRPSSLILMTLFGFYVSLLSKLVLKLQEKNICNDSM